MSTSGRLLDSKIKIKPTRRISLSAPAGRLLRGLLLILVGVTVTVGSAASDAYLHRGTSEDNSVVYRQPTGRGLATNIDLRGSSDTALQSTLNFLKAAGYKYVRQEFSWAQVQPTPTGFDWTEYRRIVDALDAVDIEVVVVLVDTPIWARAPDAVPFPDAPPITPELYESMCTALREEFPDLHMFQIGRNLDDPEYWGGKSIQAVTYRQILNAAARGLDIAATDSILIGGEVGGDPEIRQRGGDLEVLRRITRDPGIRGLLSVVAVSVDAGLHSPYDRRVATDTANLSRVVLVREAIDESGALEMPVWFTHLGWTGGGNDLISLEDQARFVESGIRRARSEWPWVGLIFNWSYAISPDHQETGALALVVNGNPTPLYDAMTNYAKSSFGSSITNGFVPPNASACTYVGNWQDQHLSEGVYRTVRDPAARVTCRFWGTGVSVFFRFSPDAGTATYAIDNDDLANEGIDERGAVFLTYRLADAFEAPVELASGLPEGEHSVTIGLDSGGELVIGGFMVTRERPMIWPIAVLVAAGLVALFLGLRAIAFLAAEHVGLVAARNDSPAATPLPILTNWKPGPRFQR